MGFSGVARVYSPPFPWDTHYQFSIKNSTLKRMNSSPKIVGNTLSDALLKSRFQNFADAVAKKHRASRVFYKNKLIDVAFVTS